MAINPEAYQKVKSELALAGISAEDEQRLKQLESRRIRPDTQIPEEEFLFRLHARPCFARGELVGLSGKAKSGKTFVCSILMALCFRNQVLSVERIEPSRLHVLWYDTEQSEESTQDILKHRIMPLAGIQKDQRSIQQSEILDEYFQIFNVRGEAWCDRLPLLETAVRYYHPDLVVLDGVRDLVSDINDGVVAQNVVERLMHLASECHCCIVCVLHQNKSIEDRNLRGWIGTELKNKAFEVYECYKSSERIFSWCQTDTRKYDIPEPLNFAVNDEGLPYRCTERQLIDAQYESQRKMADKLQKTSQKLPDMNPKYVHKEGRKHVFDVKQLFTDIMTPGQAYSEEDLKREIYAKTNALKPHMQDQALRQAIDDKIILCCTNPFGKKDYILPAPDELTIPF